MRVRFQHRLGKRLFDVAAILLALPLLVPLLAVIAVVVRVTLGRPVLFRQQRPGWHGRPFTLLKFRTMTDARDKLGRLLPDERRLTRVGRLLRAMSLDELPELGNVLMGQMSLVGPRPLLMEYLDRYTPTQARRHDVRPGITGWAQVNGRNGISWEEKLALDLWYVAHCSILLDCRILLRTVWTVLHCEGISASGHATVPRFSGGTLDSDVSV
jgi:sugar transferase EpsL